MYGTVRTVVWEDGGGNPASYPIPFFDPAQGAMASVRRKWQEIHLPGGIMPSSETIVTALIWALFAAGVFFGLRARRRRRKP